MIHDREMISWTSLKASSLREHQENEKTSHRKRNISTKAHLINSCYPKIYKAYLKPNNKNIKTSDSPFKKKIGGRKKITTVTMSD